MKNWLKDLKKEGYKIIATNGQMAIAERVFEPKHTIKTGRDWADLVDDTKFSEYLKANYYHSELTGPDFEAICKGYYK